MKIACLVGSPPMLNYFVNKLSEHLPIDLIVREQPPIRLKERISELGMLETARAIARKLGSKQDYHKDAHTVFGHNWESLPANTPFIETADINTDAIATRLADLQPDIVLVNGTSLIRSGILTNIPLVLNIHAGLSPYYRGSFCTEWALLNHDPYNIGYTIHRLSNRIDGGDILSQGRPEVSISDTARTLHMKLIKESTHELVSLLQKIAQGYQPVFHSQNTVPGFLYLARHWTPAHRNALSILYKEGGLSKMMNKPARKALPIIKG
jgi:folate-dependent phosphoribosylglycinamide formyltransferase PurN